MNFLRNLITISAVFSFVSLVGFKTYGQDFKKKREHTLTPNNLSTTCLPLSNVFYANLVGTPNYTFSSIVNNEICYSSASGINFGCLSSYDNQSWFVIEIVKDGDVNISFSNSNAYDLDAAIWGKVLNGDLNNFQQALSTVPIACDYSASNPSVIIPNAQVGELYILLISNYSNVNTEITLSQSPENSVSFKYICPQNLNITGNISGDNFYKSSNRINSNEVIQDSKVLYSAGNLIELEPGFEVQSMSVFQAEIEGCENSIQIGSLILQPGPADGKDLDVSSYTPTVIASYNNDFFDPFAWTQNGYPNNKRVFIEFDLSIIPSNSIIDSAYLDLYFSESLTQQYTIFQGHSGQNDMLIKRILSPWEQTTFTWNNQPSVTELNRVEVAAATSNNQDYPGISVKDLVQDMLVENYGFSIVHKNETPYKITCLTSSSEVNPAIRPRLRVFYHHF